MTTLIYRGVAHTGVKSNQAPMAAQLLYRGVAHLSSAPSNLSQSKPAAMLYRGVSYFKYASGQIAKIDMTADARGASNTMLGTAH